MFTVKAFPRIDSLSHSGYEADWYHVDGEAGEVNFAGPGAAAPGRLSTEHYARIVVENAAGRTVANLRAPE